MPTHIESNEGLRKIVLLHYCKARTFHAYKTEWVGSSDSKHPIVWDWAVCPYCKEELPLDYRNIPIKDN